MYRTIDLALTQTPRFYAWLLARRRRRNVEKMLFLRLLRRGDVVIDAGANEGYYTLLFSHVVGRSGQVHAFEPVPPTFQRLQEHVQRNSFFDNVVANACALGEAADVAELFVPGEDLGQASLIPHQAGSWSAAAVVHRYRCPVTTLDDYWRIHGTAEPAFLKCDVEGAELLVLRGATQLLARSTPLLYLEVCSDWTTDLGYRPAELVEFLKHLGYTNFYLVTPEVHPLTEPMRQINTLKESANLLCAVPGAGGDRAAVAIEHLRAIAPGQTVS